MNVVGTNMPLHTYEFGDIMRVEPKKGNIIDRIPASPLLQRGLPKVSEDLLASLEELVLTVLEGGRRHVVFAAQLGGRYIGGK